MTMTRAQLNRARMALGRPKAVTREGLLRTELLLDGRYCQTSLIVPRSGRIVALQGSYLTPDEAVEIEGIDGLRRDLVMGHLPNTVFQKSQAQGSGLVDEQGNVY